MYCSKPIAYSPVFFAAWDGIENVVKAKRPHTDFLSLQASLVTSVGVSVSSE